MRIVLSGQRKFGLAVLQLCEELGHEIIAVVTPEDDKLVVPYALEKSYAIIPAGTLSQVELPHFELGVMAHSFDYIGKRLQNLALHGWIGYHPSLLPRHRGRSSIEWALHHKDPITGGTLYWLNSGLDQGDIAYQEWIWLDHSKTAKQVWDEELMPLGLKLYTKAFLDFRIGIFRRTPQEPVEKFATYEPPFGEAALKPGAVVAEERNNY